ncbi:DUF4160 domain-containing protein [Pseudidiomarina sp. 1ASP75-14]|uniref:DUF4160 domain-containing protein n=1 Tax=Pseudidiomarina terrestris TaxID=2820060 RepID=UPI00264C8A92|nr:DUF4160 domain-containing protein [Pseudidiomarina sp. 1ASP75-14]MDN7138596.1 DUF4160 domain-containing protein [Pseudidiomarina sp. 1ASP75-14]
MKLSEIPIEKLKETPWFHNVDPERLRSFEDYAAWLEAILHNPCNVWEEDGEIFLIEIRQLVTRVNGLKIEVYSNEHPPPHFHVKSPNVDASFAIANCAVLEGKVDNSDRKKIELWHRKAKPLLIAAWNSTRPTNCTVGLYKGN